VIAIEFSLIAELMPIFCKDNQKLVSWQAKSGKKTDGGEIFYAIKGLKQEI